MTGSIRCAVHDDTEDAGSFSCQNHGDQLPNEQKAASDPMMQLVAPAVAELQAIITKPDTSDSDRLRAISLVLDRAGFGPKTDLSVSVRKYETVMDSIFRMAPTYEDGVYSATDSEPAPTLRLASATRGDDQGLPEQEHGSTPEPVVVIQQ